MYIVIDDTNICIMLTVFFFFFGLRYYYYFRSDHLIYSLNLKLKFETYLSCDVADKKGRNFESQRVTERQSVKVPLTPFCLPLSTVHQMSFICTGPFKQTQLKLRWGMG